MFVALNSRLHYTTLIVEAAADLLARAVDLENAFKVRDLDKTAADGRGPIGG